jgi:signal transduction histidine kinase
MPSLADLLASSHARILRRWTERIQSEPAPPGLSSGERWNDLSNILDELVTALSAGKGRSAVLAFPQDSRLARSRDTVATGGVDIEEVVREYGVLVDILLDELAATGGTLDTREWQLAMHCIVGTIASYARRRDEELRRQTARHVAFIAHELRNSLGTVGSAIAALRLAPTDESLHELLDRNLRRLRELSDDVLTADRVASSVDLQRERLDLAALLCQAVEDARAAGESRTVKISLDVDTVLEVEADCRLLLSAIGNLLSNAVKFSQPGATVRVRARREGNATIVEVQDECGGLPAGNIEKLFEPLVQRGEDRNGFGLGLAIVRQAMAAHGGRVSVRNQPGEGCTFVIALPAEDDREIPAQEGGPGWEPATQRTITDYPEVPVVDYAPRR